MFKDKFKKQRVVLGTWMQIPSGSICEIAAKQGLDWLAVDMEHTEIGFETLADMFRGLKGSKTAPFVRVTRNNALEIRRSLDIGAEGVIVPLIDTADEAKAAVSYAKYPPKGIRGHAFCRANDWGEGFSEYAKTANDRLCVFVMIESKRAVENIDEILKVDGLDGVFIGPYDMSASYGVPGNVSDALVVNGCNAVLEACKRHGKIPGIHIVNPDPEMIDNHIKKGFQFIAVGIDTLFLINGFKGIVSDVNKLKDV